MTDDLSDDAPQAAPTARRKWRPAMLWLFAGFAAFAYTFDQLTKLWVTSTMTEGSAYRSCPLCCIGTTSGIPAPRFPLARM